MGTEYSGKLSDGRKVMGFTQKGSLANLITIDKNLILDIPNEWSLEEAATIPLAYITALFALNNIDKLKTKNILIHCTADGVGQAAINICSLLKLEIFAIVNDERKKVLLQETFPHLQTKQIGCYGDRNFERYLMQQTKGKGVELVLTSSIEKQFLKCLTKQGTYILLAPFNGNSLPTNFLYKERKFQSIHLDALLRTEKKYELVNLLKKALQDGLVKPLRRNIWYESGVSGALKSIEEGCNFEKTLIKIRREDRNVVPLPKLLKGTPRYYPEGSIVVTGGLGGFGMELIDWLVQRGAKNIVIASRRASLTGYEKYRLRYIIFKNERKMHLFESCSTFMKRNNFLKFQ